MWNEGTADVKTGIDGHDQRLVDIRQNLLEHRRGGGRINGDSGALAQRPDGLDRTVEVAVTFPVEQK